MTHTHDESYADDDGFHPAYHRHAVWTMRLILAELTEGAYEVYDDIDRRTARDIIVDEVDGCPSCWQAIASRAVFEAAACMGLHFGDEEAVKKIQAELKNTLDAGRQP